MLEGRPRTGERPLTLLYIGIGRDLSEQARFCIGKGCPNDREGYQISIRYVFLFKTDGGYGPSSDCHDAHNGDNQPGTMDVRSMDGQIWRITRVGNGRWDYYINQPMPTSKTKFSKFTVSWSGTTHINIYMYMSAHKHHQYFDTRYDEEDSVYSDYGLNDEW